MTMCSYETRILHKKEKRKLTNPVKLEIVHELKPFPCTECNKKFDTTSYLEDHMENHTGENLYQTLKYIKCHIYLKSIYPQI